MDDSNNPETGSVVTAEATTTSATTATESHHFWDSWPVVGKHESSAPTVQSGDEGPQATDTPPIPSGLEQAAAKAPESKDVVAAASVNTEPAETGFVDTGPAENPDTVPASISTGVPTKDGSVGAPTPVALPTKAPAPLAPPVQIPDKTV